MPYIDLFIYIYIFIQSTLTFCCWGFTIPFPSNTKRKEVVNYQYFLSFLIAFFKIEIKYMKLSGENQRYIDG